MIGILIASAPLNGDAQNFTSDVIVTTGDTPSVFLQQDTSGGFPAHTWSFSGSEAGFLVFDETNFEGPFFIRANAPTGSFTIESDGTVGIGTFFPVGNGHSMHISGGDTDDVFSGLGPNPLTGPAFNFGYSGASFGRSSGFFNVRPDASATPPNPSLRFATANAQRMIITNIGRVGIGTLTPQQLLEVAGTVRATAFQVGTTNLNVPDYVFESDYKLRPLPELAVFLAKEKHLPEIPSAKDIKASDLDLSAFQMQLLRKVEELTLYIIEQEQSAKSQQQKIHTQDQTITQLRTTIARLTDSLDGLTTRLTVLEQGQNK